ncbi:hypothetical protein BGX12_12420 [Fibrobacter sp. UWR4]|nr:hypothetical protein BGX12_12420 [Fibrobacter sp. UWR4]PZW67431.1 hypothetical protein C8E88_102420 [Fibrobacter sp. UWR1]
MSKYEPLWKFVKDAAANNAATFKLTYEEIEKV